MNKQTGSNDGSGAQASVPLAQHGRQGSLHPLTQILRFCAVAVVVVLVSVVGVAGFTAVNLATSFGANAVKLDNTQPLPPNIAELEGGINFLIAGTDACEEEFADLFPGRCDGDAADGELNDVNMLVNISNNPRRVAVITFPRDLVIPLPECVSEDGSVNSATSASMINEAWAHGGLNCVVNTVEQLSGQDVQFAAKIDWGGVMEITDAIGGVEVCIANGIKDRHTNIDWPAGYRTIQGYEALQFLRTRHGVGDGSDLGRTNNQQQYMSRLANKVVSEEVLTNPATLLRLATVAVDNITPSDNLTNPATLVQIAMAINGVPFEDIVFLRYPTFVHPNNPNRVVPDYEGAQILWDALAANSPLILDADQGESVGVIREDELNAAPDGGAGSSPSPSPSASETIREGAVQLPSTVLGATAAENVCSNGNVR